MWNRICLSMMLLAAPALWADSAKDVEAAERAWAKGVTTNDLALLGKVMGDDLTYTHSTGATDTKASYIDKLKTGKAHYFKVEYDQLKVEVLTADTAITIDRAQFVTLKDGKQDPAHLSFLHVWVKRQGQWQLVAHQSAKLTN